MLYYTGWGIQFYTYEVHDLCGCIVCRSSGGGGTSSNGDFLHTGHIAVAVGVAVAVVAVLAAVGWGWCCTGGKALSPVLGVGAVWSAIVVLGLGSSVVLAAVGTRGGVLWAGTAAGTVSVGGGFPC